MPIAIVRGATGAVFSPCRKWRYLLWRQWDASKPAANFLMLNPSTADESKLDPTCARARDYAERWGYGALIVTNVFGWRATDPTDMKAAKDPVGPGNDAAIVRARRIVLEGAKAFLESGLPPCMGPDGTGRDIPYPDLRGTSEVIDGSADMFDFHNRVLRAARRAEFEKFHAPGADAA